MTLKEYKDTYKPKYNKYKNRKTEIDNIVFDSKKEADYYLYLKTLEKKGIIDKFERQVEYILQPSYIHNGKKIRSIKYYLDFKVYYKDGHIEYVDVKSSKSFQDPLYKLKKKLLHYKYPEITITEVYNVPQVI